MTFKLSQPSQVYTPQVAKLFTKLLTNRMLNDGIAVKTVSKPEKVSHESHDECKLSDELKSVRSFLTSVLSRAAISVEHVMREDVGPKHLYVHPKKNNISIEIQQPGKVYLKF